MVLVLVFKGREEVGSPDPLLGWEAEGGGEDGMVIMMKDGVEPLFGWEAFEDGGIRGLGVLLQMEKLESLGGRQPTEAVLHYRCKEITGASRKIAWKRRDGVEREGLMR